MDTTELKFLLKNAILAPSVEDNKMSRIKMGEAYQRITLAATGIGMQHSMNQDLIEVLENRERLRKRLGINEIPQFAFKLGYALPVKHQVRRSLKEVVTNGGKHGK